MNTNFVLRSRTQVHLRSIPGFQRRLENATDFAATRLHAILYNGKEAQKDLREEILNWRGVSGDALPSLYLRLVRWFEATGSTRWSKTQLVRFCFSVVDTHTHTQLEQVRLMDMLGLRNHIKRKFSSLRVSQICEILSLALAYPSYSHTFQVSPYLVEDVKIDYVAQQEEDEDEVDHVGDGMTIAGRSHLNLETHVQMWRRLKFTR